MNNDNIYTLETLIGSNYVRYDKLSQLIQESYNGSTSNMLNIFIDLFSIRKQIYSAENQNLTIVHELELSANLINLCSHYRQFFNRMNVKTNFVFIDSIACSASNTQTCPEYNNKFISNMQQSRLNGFIENNFKALSILCPYLPDIHFVNIVDLEVSGYILYLMNKYSKPNIENIVITKDILPYQLVSYNCKVLRPKKYKGEDMSFMINHNNVWEQYIYNNKKSSAIKSDSIINNMHSSYLTNLFAITGLPERNMNYIKNFPTGYGVIRNMILNGTINSLIPYEQSVLNNMLGMVGFPGNYTLYDFRWKCISAIHVANIISNNVALSNIRFVNLRDRVGLDKVLHDFYGTYPIDLERL